MGVGCGAKPYGNSPRRLLVKSETENNERHADQSQRSSPAGKNHCRHGWLRMVGGWQHCHLAAIGGAAEIAADRGSAVAIGITRSGSSCASRAAKLVRQLKSCR